MSQSIDMLDSKWDKAFMGLTIGPDGDDMAVYCADVIAAMTAEKNGGDHEEILNGIAGFALDNPSIMFVFTMPANKVGLREVLH